MWNTLSNQVTDRFMSTKILYRSEGRLIDTDPLGRRVCAPGKGSHQESVPFFFGT